MTNTTIAPPTSKTAPVRSTVATVSVMGILVVGQMYVTIPLMPDIGDAWSVPTESAAAATASFALAHAVGSLTSGPLAARWGRRAVMVINVLLMALVTALVPLASGLGSGVALRALQGFLAGAFIPMAYAYISARLPRERIAFALTVVSACMGATVVLGQLEAQLLASLFGWASVFWITAPLLLAGAGVTWKVLLPDPAAPRGPAGKAAPLLDTRSVLTPALLTLYASILIGAATLTAVYTGIQLYGPPSLTEDSTAMLILRASALPALLGAVLLAPVLSRFPSLIRARGAALVTGAALLAAALFGGSVTALGVSLFLFMFGFATLGPALVQAVGERAGTAQTTAIALYGFTLNVGAGTGAQLPSLVPSFTSLAWTLALASAVAVGLICVCGAQRPAT